MPRAFEIDAASDHARELRGSFARPSVEPGGEGFVLRFVQVRAGGFCQTLKKGAHDSRLDSQLFLRFPAREQIVDEPVALRELRQEKIFELGQRRGRARRVYGQFEPRHGQIQSVFQRCSRSGTSCFSRVRGRRTARKSAGTESVKAAEARRIRALLRCFELGLGRVQNPAERNFRRLERALHVR